MFLANNNSEQGASSIPELTGLAPSSKRRKCDDEDDQDDLESDITFTNPPFLIWTHYDHQEKVDIVSVVLPVISGSENVDFVLSEDGMKLIVKYTWPALVVVPRVLFSRRGNMPMSHPRINSMAAELVKRGISERNKPVGNITVRLPVKVQREIGTWGYEGMRMNNTDAILFNFKAFQAKAVVEGAATSVDFL